MIPLLLTTSLLGSGVAYAGDTSSRAPVRCEAVWTGPDTGCDLAGSWAATGLGRNEDAARAAALERLQRALVAGASATALRGAAGAPTAASTGSRSPQGQTCGKDLSTRVRFSCFNEDELREQRLCFADMPDADCWTSDPIVLEGTVWREMEHGRDQVCNTMEDALRANNTPADQVEICRARCNQVARVRCPSGLLDDADAWEDRPYHMAYDGIIK